MAVEFLIAGLGNPGPEYADTRHNAGFWFVDHLAARAGQSFRQRPKLHGDEARVSIGGVDCALLKPTTMMNRSGIAVRALCDWYRIPLDRLLVAHDELDLPAGVARLKKGGGHGGHNGLRDLHAHLSAPDYLRLRLGIGHPGSSSQVVGYVLGRTPATERALVDRAIGSAEKVMADVVNGRLSKAMKELHTATAVAGGE
ncbi:MAG: aminoacyl-tRNA hydrolase [Wenzhouxiangellaceae bacterium]